MADASNLESVPLHTPRDPFAEPVNSAVFNEPQLPMRILPIQDGFLWWLEAFRLFKLDMLRWIGAGLIFLLLCALVLKIPLLGPILQHVLQTVLLGGLLLGCRRVDAGERFRIGSLFWAFERHHFQTLTIMALVMIVGFVAFFLVIGISLGALGLAVSVSHVVTLTNTENLPMIVLLLLITTLAVSAVGMFYWFAPGLIVFCGVGPIDAMRLSFVASLKNMAPMLTFGIVAALILLAGLVLASFGNVGVVVTTIVCIVLGPVALVTFYTSTRAVFGSATSADPAH